MKQPDQSQSLHRVSPLNIALIALLTLAIWPLQAADYKPNVSALIRDTQKTSHHEGAMTIVWWIPEEYWRASFAESSKMTEAQKEDFLKTIRPYFLVAVVDGMIGRFAGVTYKSEKEIRDGLVVVDKNGNRFRPLDRDEVDADMRNLLSMMRPVMANMLGSMGQNLNIYAFPAKDKKRRTIADPNSEGSFKVLLDAREFVFRLPLGSLLPPKKCAKCNEEASGAYKFCPYDGTALPK